MKTKLQGDDLMALSENSQKIRRYCPSNGTEGSVFIDYYCMRCVHERFSHTQNDEDKKCDILSRSLIYDVNEEEFPDEWTYDEDTGEPTCTAFSKWNWDEMGDPDDPENPNYVMPYNPNQLVLEFSDVPELIKRHWPL